MPVISALERLRQNSLESHANLGYIVIQTLPFNKRKRGKVHHLTWEMGWSIYLIYVESCIQFPSTTPPKYIHFYNR